MDAINYSDRLVVIRTVVSYLIDKTSEQKEVYAYFSKSSNRIITLSINPSNDYIDKSDLIIYKVTLKNLFLFCLKEEYKTTSWDLLVLLANKTIKNYSSEDISFLLNVSLEKYKRLESGNYLFNGELSYKNVSEKLEFSESEFYYDFRKVFLKVN